MLHQSLNTIIEPIIIKAGAILRRDFFNQKEIHNKGEHDIVTATDLASEELIIQSLQAHFPMHTLVSEEVGMINRQDNATCKDAFSEEDIEKALALSYMANHHNGAQYTWYIDPIDGTSNFVTGCPYFAVSIALAYCETVIFGMVYQPITDELYTASLGKGASRNGEPIRVSSRARMADAYIATAYSADEQDIKDGTLMAKNIALRSRRTVLNFCPAVDLCNIARGRLDALVDNGSTVEDHAAGSIILSEAGGALQNLHAEGWDFKVTGIAASNGSLKISELKSILNTEC